MTSFLLRHYYATSTLAQALHYLNEFDTVMAHSRLQDQALFDLAQFPSQWHEIM